MKWADYVITAVNHQHGHSTITHVQVRPDLGETLGQAVVWTRADVLKGLDTGRTFVTAFLRDGKWQLGADVHAVTVGWERYLRSDHNAIRADNLDSLPEFDQPAYVMSAR